MAFINKINNICGIFDFTVIQQRGNIIINEIKQEEINNIRALTLKIH